MRAIISIVMSSHNADRFGILTFTNFQEILEMTDRSAACQALDEYDAAVLVKRQFIRRPDGIISVEYIYDATGRHVFANMLNAYTNLNVVTDYNNYCINNYGIIDGPQIHISNDTITCG